MMLVLWIKIEEIHGELMSGTIGDRIVELAACWAVVLIVTGLFFYGGQKATKGAWCYFFPRLNQGKKRFCGEIYMLYRLSG
ncbi:hypothetical protein GCM10020331_006360 [Ectobacillus funiculus]